MTVTSLVGYAETLAVEVEPFNITVTCIEPGKFRTLVFKVRLCPSIHPLSNTLINESRRKDKKLQQLLFQSTKIH